MILYFAKKPFLVIFLLTFLMMMFLDHVLGMESSAFRAGIAAVIAVVLSPRIKKIKTQTGKRKQVTWFLLKTPIFLDK
jgi:hypothetical protein